jgi:hypothetical protein
VTGVTLRSGIAVVIAIVVGIIMTIDQFVKLPAINNPMAEIRNWMPVITSFATIVGSVGLLTVHYKNIQRRRSGWYNSVVLWVVMLYIIALGCTKGTTDATYTFLFDNILTSSSNTLSAVGALFLASAGFRAFRATNSNASILLIAGAIVMLAQVPIGEAMWDQIPNLGSWIMNVPNNAGQRGILIASGIGFMAICLRIIVGYSRSYLGGSGE